MTNTKSAMYKMALLLFLQACNKAPKLAIDSHSDLNQITNDFKPCTPPNAQKLAQVKKQVPATMLNGFTPGTKDYTDVWTALARLPDPYREHLIKSHQVSRFTISSLPFINALGGAAAGLTSLGLYPTFMQVKTGMAFVSMHEFGHAVQYSVDQTTSTRGLGLMNQINNLMQTEGVPAGERGQVRSYAVTNNLEYFAESFDSYYCSPETNSILKTTLPQTFSFLETVLEKPTWISETGLRFFVRQLEGQGDNANKLEFYVSTGSKTEELSVCLSDEESCRNDESAAKAKVVEVSGLAKGIKVHRFTVYESDLRTSTQLSVVARAGGNIVESRAISYGANMASN